MALNNANLWSKMGNWKTSFEFFSKTRIVTSLIEKCHVRQKNTHVVKQVNLSFNSQLRRTIRHFILKNAPNSIIWGGLSDYIMPSLNPLEIVRPCLFNTFPMSVHVRLANSHQHFLSVCACFKWPIFRPMPVWMGGWTCVAHFCLALKSITKHRQAHNVICECSIFLV